jgi:hypothetical protein
MPSTYDGAYPLKLPRTRLFSFETCNKLVTSLFIFQALHNLLAVPVGSSDDLVIRIKLFEVFRIQSCLELFPACAMYSKPISYYCCILMMQITIALSALSTLAHPRYFYHVRHR